MQINTAKPALGAMLTHMAKEALDSTDFRKYQTAQSSKVAMQHFSFTNIGPVGSEDSVAGIQTSVLLVTFSGLRPLHLPFFSFFFMTFIPS